MRVNEADAERILLTAVRDHLRDVCKLQDFECEIEPDEMVPAVAGDLYVAVIPGGFRQGLRHDTNSGVSDMIYGVDVAVIKRVAHVPRDRLRDVFLNNLRSLNYEVGRVISAIDWSYTVSNAATTLIAAESDTEGFIEPLRMNNLEKRPRVVPAEVFGATGGHLSGMLRIASFYGARRLAHR